MPGFAFGETVTLIGRQQTSRDADGNAEYTETRTPFPGAVFSPAGSTENLAGQDTVNTTASFTWMDVVPTTLDAYSAIERPNGDQYEIVGTPMDYATSFSGLRVLQVHVNRIS